MIPRDIFISASRPYWTHSYFKDHRCVIMEIICTMSVNFFIRHHISMKQITECGPVEHVGWHAFFFSLPRPCNHQIDEIWAIKNYWSLTFFALKISGISTEILSVTKIINNMWQNYREINGPFRRGNLDCRHVIWVSVHIRQNWSRFLCTLSNSSISNTFLLLKKSFFNKM